MEFLLAFLCGGVLCVIAQILIDKTALTPARILVLYVSFGTLLGAVGIYDELLSLFGCGISVPIIGFGGVVAEGVREAVDQMGALGIFKGSLTAASSGICAALVFGYLCALIFPGTPKRT